MERSLKSQNCRIARSKKRRSNKRNGRNHSVESLETRHLLTSIPVLVDDLNAQTSYDYAQINESVTITNQTTLESITYFTADDGVHGRELWRTDGRKLGTRMVKDIHDGTNSGQPVSSNPSELVDVDGTLFFKAVSPLSNRAALFKSDGEATDTVEVELTGAAANLNTNSIGDLTPVGDKLFFRAIENGKPGYRLWVTDGTTTTNLTNLNEQAGVIPASLPIENVNDKLVFWADNGSGRTEMWTSDGSTASQVTDFNPSYSFRSPNHRDQLLIPGTANNDRLYFTGWEAGKTTTLWVTDGTLAGTKQVSSGGFIATQMANVDGKLFFRAYESGYGYELWTSDGTDDGTFRITDINPGYRDSYPQSITAFGSTVYFTARESDGGAYTRWRAYLENGEYTVTPSPIGGSGIEFDGSLFFRAYDATMGEELFRLNADDTIVPFDLAPGNFGSSPHLLTVVNDSLMFIATKDNAGGALWISDGTIENTEVLIDINQNTESTSFQYFTELNGSAYFSGPNGELFVTDGTPAGTTQVTDVHPGAGSPNIQELVKTDDAIYFTGFDGISSDKKFWKFDGVDTTEISLPGLRWPDALTAVDGRVYFNVSRSNDTLQHEAWVTDGTAAGTRRLFTYPQRGYCCHRFQEVGNDLFYTDYQGNNFEVYRTDKAFSSSGRIESSVLVQPDGKLVAIGSLGASLGPSLMVMRFNADGSIDTSFGDHGRVVNYDLVGAFGKAAMQADGKIVIGTGFDTGTTNGARHEIAVVRLLPDGSYDPDFGDNGTVIHDLPGFNDGVTSLALQLVGGEERIVLATDPIAGQGQDYDVAVVRLNTDGSLDLTFGEDADSNGTPDGYTITDGAGLNDYASTILVSPVDQSIILAGSIETSYQDWETSLLGYTANGILNSSYGSSGILTIPDTGVQFEGAVVLSDGSVVAVGDAIYSGANNDALVVKVTPTGTLDTNFGDGNSGISIIENGGQSRAIVELSNGSFVISSPYGGNGAFTGVFKVNASGQLDASFADSGFLTTQYGRTNGVVSTLSVQPHPTNGQEKVILAGSAWGSGNAGWALGRIDLAGNFDTSFGNQSNVVIDFGVHKFADDLAGTGIIGKPFPMASGNNLYFAAQDATNDRQLWVMPGGYNPLRLTNFDANSSIYNLTDVNGQLYFTVHAPWPQTVTELWTSDGTISGTKRVKVIEDSEQIEVRNITVFGNQLAFTVSRLVEDPDWGSQFIATEVWLSNGTANGTDIVEQVTYPSEQISALFSSNGFLYYQKFEDATGWELWSYDGSSVQPVGEFDLGPASSAPTVYDIAGETFVAATTRKEGRELWRLLDSDDPGVLPPTVQLPAGSGTVEIKREGNDLVVRKGGVAQASWAIGTVAGITLQGASESEVFFLEVDGLSRPVLPYGVTIAGGEGTSDNDTLILSGSQTVSNYDYTTGGPESGTITLDDFEVTFSEFEPIIDHLNAVNRSFHIGTPGSQTIVLRGDANGTLLSDRGTGSFESLLFDSQSTAKLTISAGDGDDEIVIESLDDSFATEVIADGGDGNDSINASLTDQPVHLIGGAGDDVLLGGSANDTIDGGAGNDIIDAGAGSDSVDGGGGLNNVASDPEDGAVTVNVDEFLAVFTSFADPQSATFDWGDGTITPGSVDLSTGQVSAEHAYPQEGAYTLTINVTDSLGDVTTRSLNVTVVPLVAAGGEVLVSASGVVRIGGTAEDDDIVVRPTSDGQFLQVTLNGVIVHASTPLAQVGEIRAWGHEGKDHIELIDLAVASMLDGGAGDDLLAGGDGHNILLGRSGLDHLIGGGGDDFLIGGTQADRIVGGAGHDILVSDDLSDDLSLDMLRQIVQDWAHAKTADQTTSTSVIEETLLEGVDRLTGGSGSDWFIVGLDDDITDSKKTTKDGDLVQIA